MADEKVRNDPGGKSRPPVHIKGEPPIPGGAAAADPGRKESGPADTGGGAPDPAAGGQPVQVFQFVQEQPAPAGGKARAATEKRPTAPAPAPEVLFKGAAIHPAGRGAAPVAATPPTVAQAAPRVVKVRNVEATLSRVAAHVIPNKVIVQGVVHLQIFFVTGDGLVRHLGEDVPFHAMLEVPGAVPGMTALVQAVIAAVLFHLSEDGAALVKKVVIDVFAKVVQEIQIGLAPGTGPTLLLPEVIAEGATRVLRETTVTLGTPAAKIEEIRGEIRNLAAEPIADKVIIQGTLHKQIFFIDTNDISRHQAEDVPFSAFIDLPGAGPGLDVEVTPVIEAISFEQPTPDTVRQKAMVALSARVTRDVAFQTTEDGEDLYHVAQVVGAGSEQVLRRDVVTLATPAAKIRDIAAELRDLRTHLLPGKVIVQGTVHKQIFYIGADDIERHQAEDAPFSAMVEIPGVVPGMTAIAAPVIEDLLHHLLSPTELEEKVLIRADVTVVQEIQIPLRPGCDSQFLVERVIGEDTTQVLVRLVNVLTPFVKRVFPLIVAGETCGEEVFSAQTIVENEVCLPVCAAKVAGVAAEIRSLQASPVPGGVLVSGEVFKDVRLIGADDVVRHIEETVPFSLIVETPGAAGDPRTVEAEIEQILFGLGPDNRVLRQIVVVVARAVFAGTATGDFQVITELAVPGLDVETVLVEAKVRTDGGVELRQFPVITGLSGPGLALVEDPVFGTHSFQVVGDGARELNVLERITVDP